MKRGRLVFLTIIGLCLSLGGKAEGEWYSMVQLRENTPARWQQTYSTVQGGSVTADCPILIPKAEAAPVLRVDRYPKLDAAVRGEFSAPDLSPHYIGHEHFRRLMIHGQTGKLYDLKDCSVGRCDAPAFFTWEMLK